MSSGWSNGRHNRFGASEQEAEWISKSRRRANELTVSERLSAEEVEIIKAKSLASSDEDEEWGRRSRPWAGFVSSPETKSNVDTTFSTNDDSRYYDNNDDDDENKRAGPCGFLSSTCCHVLVVALALSAIFGLGVFVGMKMEGSNNELTSANAESSNYENDSNYNNDQQSSGQNYESNGSAVKLLVGAYYYPWHGANFHNGGGYVRNQLQPPQYPTLGEYDDSKSETITQHLKWSRQANIGLWVTSWWGPNRLEDTNTRYVIMDHDDIGDMQIALHYETTGRIRDNDISNIPGDIKYMCETYFDHPNYYKIDGRPVIVIYITRKLERLGILEDVIFKMRQTASQCGHNIYIVGDHVFRDAPENNVSSFFYFDAVTNYDVYGSMGSPTYYAGSEIVDAYYSEQAEWKSQALGAGCRFIPAVSPGFNDRGVRLEVDHPPLSRKLTEDSVEGSLFSYAISKAKHLVDPLADNMLLVNSFNEWHEDSQIEPVVGETTMLPSVLTGGVEYSGYGELYLNILREETIFRAPTVQEKTNIFADDDN